MNSTILIVDDEKSTRNGLRMALEDEFDCYVASDIREAMNILTSEKIALVLTDLRMGGDSGMDLLDKILKLPSPPIAIMMTAYGSVDTAVEAMRRGAWHFVTKPLNIDEVELMIKRALRSKTLESANQKLENENQELRKKVGNQPHGLEPLIGKSPAMVQIHAMITQIAPTKATVLIEGESGTGKEVVANTIHTLSGRPKDKIITVNCAALSPQLLESELFGHEKGAFTGASQRRIGRFEQANGGTLFLDEIGEIDPAIQVKLLRVLSERTIERVGSNTPIAIDVRVVTATNKNLAKMVSKGDFREDLFFRLNVVKMTLPPLRARKEDIVLLANAFLNEFNKENNKKISNIAPAAFQQIQHYNWPGNVRELRTAIEHGVVMCTGSTIESAQLPLNVQSGSSLIPQSFSEDREATNRASSAENTPLEFNLHAIESATILQALQHTNNNRTIAAELLGISRRTLQRKLKELDA